MRWIVLFLLLTGALSGVATSMGSASGQVLPTASRFAAALAGWAAAAYLAAAIGVIRPLLPVGGWRRLVAAAAVGSLLSLTLGITGSGLLSAVLGVILLWGIARKGWMGAAAAAPAGNTARAAYPTIPIPIPWVFVLIYLAGASVERVWPAPAGPPGVRLSGLIAGGLLMGAGVTLAIWSLGLFRRSRTTTIPGELSSQLVTVGPYRRSRNPMYVALTLAYLGEAGMLAQVWPVLLLPLILIYLHRSVIPVEEARLRERFGDRYDQYRAAVRRWL
jgi:protein-S-isoprenylcysteine O-methyltransferase Ste14